MPRDTRAPISLLLLARLFSAGPSSPVPGVAYKFAEEDALDLFSFTFTVA